MGELKTTLGDKVEFRMIYADKEKPIYFSNLRSCSFPPRFF